MRSGRAVTVVLLIVAIGPWALAQPSPEEPRKPDAGYIGKHVPDLEIDDCRALDPALSEAALRQRASEHFERGETLYVQGDYDGAVTELVAAYCVIPFYRILKDIGQAYERSLEYEKAIAYLERYVAGIPADAKRESQCSPDPQEDKLNVARRVAVLTSLPSRVYVETTPAGAAITIRNESVTARAKSGDQIEIGGGSYEMTVEREGYQPVSKPIEVRIGKPYTYYVKLEPLKGTLVVQVTPPDARVFLGDRFVGIGRFNEVLAGGEYQISAEAPDRTRVERRIEVLPNQTHREQIELAPLPQTGRTQLIAAATVGGGLATGALLYAFSETSIAGAGTLVGGAAGLFGAWFGLPRDLSLGTSNLTITAGLAGTVAGFAGARVFTDRTEIQQPLVGAGLLLGASAGYVIGQRFDVTPGAAALFNSTVLWGTATGTLFAVSFNTPRAISAGLVLSGLGMGGIGGVLMTRYYAISRTHAVLIDVGGLAGVVGGLALESLVYPDKTVSDEASGGSDERLANFALGGMAVGLIGAGILTRNVDVPTLPVRASFGTATGVDGTPTTTYGVAGSW